MRDDDIIEMSGRAFSALERDDIDAFLEMVEPEVEFNSLVAEADTGIFRGHEGVREWWQMVKDAVGGMHFQVEQMKRTEDPDVAVVEITVVGEVSGVEVSQRMWQVVYGPEGRARWWGIHRTEDEAREAGLARAARG